MRIVTVDLDLEDILDQADSADIIAYLKDNDGTLPVDNVSDTWHGQMLDAACDGNTDRVLELAEELALYERGMVVEL